MFGLKIERPAQHGHSKPARDLAARLHRRAVVGSPRLAYGLLRGEDHGGVAASSKCL